MPLTDDLPDEWQWPPEIDVPTPYPETNLAIKILSCEFIGHDVQAAVGRFVTEQALYMIWYVREVKQSGFWTANETAILGNIPIEQTRRAYEAWKAFDAISGLSAPDDVLGEQRVAAAAALTRTLNNSAATLVQTRETAIT